MSAAARLLVIDDEPGIRELLAFELSAKGYQVETAATGEEGLRRLGQAPFDLVLSDVLMPGMGGLKALDAVKKLQPEVEVVMMTGYATVESAVEAMKQGAYDFISKPFNLQELFALVEKALEKGELKAILGVHQASRAVFESMELSALLPLVAGLACRILKADDLSIMLLEGDELKVAACCGLDLDERRDSRVALGQRVAGRVALLKAPVHLSGPLAGDARFSDVRGLREIRDSLVCPLAAGGETLGVINANRVADPAPFSDSDLRHLTIFAAQAAQAVRNARLYGSLQEQMARLQESYRELERTQAELVQSEKLAAIGRLSAGIAHELNNPLTGILGFCQLLLEEEGLSKEQRESLDCIHDQTQRCRRIASDLLEFSRKRAPQRERVDVAAVAEAALSLARYDLAMGKVAVRRQFADPPPQAWADPFQLRQVLLNLLTNALQAMEARPPRELTLRVEADGDRVRLHCRDTGCGISPENLARLFTPFFTTKAVGKGTGLGLSLCRDILDAQGGRIFAESEAGKGSSFTIELPAAPPGEQ